MLRFILLAILFILVARAFWRIMDGVIAAARGDQKGPRSGRSAAMKLSRDPVCGTYVPPRAALSLTADGSTYYFCSDQCKATFVSRQ